MKQRLILILIFVLVSCNTTQTSTLGTDVPTRIFATKIFPSQTEPPANKTVLPDAWTPPPTPTLRANVHLNSSQSINVISIQMIDSQNGWGFDSDFHILHTNDGAQSWQDVSPPEGYFEPRGFFALNANVAWATFTLGLYSMPTNAFVWRTTDGGKTWISSETFSITLDSDKVFNSADFYIPLMMEFIDDETGWLLVYVYSGMNSTHPLLLHTTDSGTTWITINDRIHGLLSPWGCLNVGFAFINAKTGWVGSNCIAQGVIINPLHIFFPSGGLAVRKTTDAGYSFDDETILPLPSALQGQDMANDDAVCGETRVVSIAINTFGVEWQCVDFTQKKTYSFFALTSNSGQTWNTWESAGNEYFLDSKLGWRLFSPGILQHTNDGGLTWTTIKSVAWETAQFDFVSEQKGWAVVRNDNASALVHTTNGGFTWTEIKPIIAP